MLFSLPCRDPFPVEMHYFFQKMYAPNQNRSSLSSGKAILILTYRDSKSRRVFRQGYL